MNIVNVRRTSQVFFFSLFLWFCIVNSFGLEWWQLRGWPVNWFLQLDPLVAIGTILTTRSVYAGLLWALLTVLLTILLGRFFCGWVCPFGSIHQFVGYVANRSRPLGKKSAGNSYHSGQAIKYYILILLLAVSAGSLIENAMVWPAAHGYLLGIIGPAVLVAWVFLQKRKTRHNDVIGILILTFGVLAGSFFTYSAGEMIGRSLQIGLLDPIPLVYRSINMVLLPLADSAPKVLSVSQRHYEGAWFIGLLFITAVLMNLKIPRFYCRYICPLGALYGILGRFALFRMGKKQDDCAHCKACEAACEGACEPTRKIRTAECILCMNCLDGCKHNNMGYRTVPSASHEMAAPDISRRGLVAALASGIALVPVLRLSGGAAENWDPSMVRPPGALSEQDFLSRCIKCGQCMRVCPTNVIHPSGLQREMESLWTPVLNFRIGTSGCQLNCIACSHVCPTAALRPISLDEKLGRGAFVENGPIRLGTAFVDPGRCLPWAMDTPCIVCQENCPVSPKAIFVREHFVTVRGGAINIKRADRVEIELQSGAFQPGQFATGDYFLLLRSEGEPRLLPITENGDRTLGISPSMPLDAPPAEGSAAEIQVRLQRPYVDPKHCIGCGICEHECPVSGRRAIRVTAENESRNRRHSLLL